MNEGLIIAGVVLVFIVITIAKGVRLVAQGEEWVVERLGKFPLPVEVIPMARNVVARRLQALGGRPVLREGFITDNGGEILDVAGLDIPAPAVLESQINDIPGVVGCGLFAISGADLALVSSRSGVRRLHRPGSQGADTKQS